MKKLQKLLWMTGIIFLLFNSPLITVKAQTRTESFTLTDENRYNPEYYKPLTKSGETLDRAGGATLPAGLEETVVNALKNHETSIDVTGYNLTISDKQYATIYWQILNNHPELFFVESYISVSYCGNTAISYTPSYSMTKAEAAVGLSIMEEAADEATEMITSDMTDYEKALVVHDWLVVYCEYDKERLNSNTVPAVSHGAYGALVNKMAVCDGYSKAYKYIMESKLSIPTYIVSSDPMNHAWNMIQIGGKYYHVDATWDDPTWDSIGRVTHNNFLLSDTGINSSGHYSWVTDLTASDTTYESALWKSSNGKIVPCGNNWYYVDNSANKLVKTSDLLGSQKTAIQSLGVWKTSENGSWTGAFSYPQVYKGKYLIFNDAKVVYKLNMRTDIVTTLYTPTDAELTDVATNIFGLKLDGETLYYAVQSTPNLQKHQRAYIKSATVEIEPRITGSVSIDGEVKCDSTLTANVTLGSGIETDLSYSWYRDGIKIRSAAGQTYKITTDDIGKVLSVKVTGEDYSGTLTAQTATVPKIVPEKPTVDFTLSGIRGKQLSTLTLPSGYAWVDPSTIMSTAGNCTYEVTYCPDETIYEKVTGVSVTVSVVCKEHEYDDGVVTKEPAVGETGIRKYTCIYCDSTKEEVIPALAAPDDGSGSGNEGGTNPDGGGTGTNPQENVEKDAIKKGAVFTDSKSKNKYKITKVTSKVTEASFAGTASKTKKTISIPATVKYKGKTVKVTKVAKNALKNNKKVNSVIVGENITTIEAGAFEGCKNLKTITIKSTNIKSFGKNCIKNINKKATIKCPKGKKSAYKKKLTKKTGYISSMKVK